ncbi:MAG: fibrobacter succinogenes major paralogous domain-containing protein [Bacteroidales bacterium]|nr:fibrobacter succinogenes major paralogous domain-containing protein [Bacteroidales bacterium]
MMKTSSILIIYILIVFVLTGCSPTEVEPIVLKDIDGNTYKTVKIGNQFWMAENLRVTHYRDGTPINHVTADSNWIALSAGAYCAYNNSEHNAETYGYLYNWYAVDDSRNIAPEGWHVPTEEEWMQLETHLGMPESELDDKYRGIDEGGKMKEADTTHWHSPNTGATNESGFSALPGGYRHGYFTFSALGYCASFWSSSASNNYHAWSRHLIYYDSYITRIDYDKKYGHSVRCIQD